MWFIELFNFNWNNVKFGALVDGKKMGKNL